MSSTRTPVDSATPDARTPVSREGVHTVTLSKPIQVRLSIVDGAEDPPISWWVARTPAGFDGEPPLGRIQQADEDWIIRPYPNYGSGAVRAPDFESALRRLASMALGIRVERTDGQVEDAADVSASESDESKEGEGLRDYVPVGLDVPVEVYKEPGALGVGFWYYVHAQKAVVGLVERHEDRDGGYYWAGLAEPDYGAVIEAATMQEAIDGLVRYALNVEVELREEMRTDKVPGERVV